MKKILPVILAIALLCLVGCDDTPDTDCLTGLNFTSYSINLSETYGFDDWSSTGAALCVAIDQTKNAAIVVALKFTLPVYSKTFSPNCNPLETAETYFFSLSNTITESLATDFPYIAPLLTNTYGIRSMDNQMAAFLVIKGETPETNQYFIAVGGSIDLTRLDEYDRLEGDLNFAEITEATENADIKKDGLALKVENIYLRWDTNQQP